MSLEQYLLYLGPGVKGNGIPKIKHILTNFNIPFYATNTLDLIKLEDFVGLIMMGGSSRIQKAKLGKNNIKKIIKYVHNGGKYTGFCAGAYLGCKCTTGIGLVNALIIKGNRKRGRGVSNIKTSNKIIQMTYHNGPVFKKTDSINVIGTYDNEIGEQNGLMQHNPAILHTNVGKGSVILCGPHPEQTDGLEQFTADLVTHNFDL